MISPTNNDASERSGKSHNVSCFDDSFNSDDDLSVEQSAQTNKRQKMTEEERLTRCRERNRVHARNTRERKKSQMDGLQSRIQELVDEKKRLNSTASESSVASILMSLAGFDNPTTLNEDSIFRMDSGDENTPVSFSFKVDDDEDDISLSIEKLKMQVSALLGDEDCKDIADTDPLLSKDKSTCSTSELEMIRRERNRMHAKKTRLRKKKMIHEMETIISSLEKEVTALQGGLITVVPKTEELRLLHHPHSIAQMKNASDDVVSFRNHGSYKGDPLAAIHSVMSKQEDLNYMGGILGISVPSLLPKLIPVDVPSSSSKKRKHSNSAAPTGPLTVPIQIRQKHFPSPYEVTAPSEEGTSVREAQGVRGSQQYLWRQHMSKNPVKTVSVCSETASGSSEGSVSEGDLSSGSAVHSLLHMSRTNSSDSRGSGSGSDESDAAASDQTPPSNQTSGAHSRNHINTARIEKRASPLMLSTQNIVHTVGPTQSLSPCPPATTPKTIQAILAACESKIPPQSPVPNSNYDPTVCAQNHPHWRVPERSTSHNSSAMGIMSDVRIAASTVAAVASIYPCTDAIDDPTSYLAYVSMKAIDAPGPCFQPHYDGVRNNKFTVYGGNKPHNGSVNSNNHSNTTENNNTYLNNSVKMENTTISSVVSTKKKGPSISPEIMRDILPELQGKEFSTMETLRNNMKGHSEGNMMAGGDKSNNKIMNKNDYSLYVPYGVEIAGPRYQYHDSRDRNTECNNEDLDSYVIKEKQTPLENFLKAEELRLQPCSKAIVTGGCRLKLTEGILDCSRFKSSEIMPPSL